MADAVQRVMDLMVPELDDLLEQEIFTKVWGRDDTENVA